MEKTKEYNNIRFTSTIIEKTHKKFLEIVKKYLKSPIKLHVEIPQILQISIKDERWDFDHFEEFLSMVDESTEYWLEHMTDSCRFTVQNTSYSASSCKCEVSVSFSDRFNIETVFNIFEKDKEKCRITTDNVVTKNKIFIGHGKDKQWRDLKDHLIEKHGFDVVCYELTETPGITIKDTLEHMLNLCNFAILAFTGEDFDVKGLPHARENVIHELGLFQGRLGFENAIVLLEENVREFSNIIRSNQIHFNKGNIKETFGDIVSILNN